MITDYTIQPMFMVATDFDELGLGGPDVTNSFNDAVDQFCDMKDKGNDSRVIRIDLMLGKSSDVTADAIDCTVRQLQAGNHDFPDWLDYRDLVA